MARIKKAETATPAANAGTEPVVSQPIDALVVVEKTAIAEVEEKPDSFVVADREVDRLYQQVKDSNVSPQAKLSSLNTALRLKMSLIDFKARIIKRG